MQGWENILKGSPALDSGRNICGYHLKMEEVRMSAPSPLVPVLKNYSSHSSEAGRPMKQVRCVTSLSDTSLYYVDAAMLCRWSCFLYLLPSP